MIYLASTSPRRHTLLGSLGIPFRTVRVSVPESWDGAEPAQQYVVRLAAEKAAAGKAVVPAGSTVIAADTAVVLDGEVLGKPADRDAARAMLGRLSGRQHQVLSAVAVAGAVESVRLNESLVTFRELTEAECLAYCQTDEPYDKAGGYAIQGRAAAFIRRLSGSYSGVMGLPLADTASLLMPVTIPGT